LIGYTQTDEAKRNALRALVMNLAGGLAFALAIVFLHHRTGSIDLQVTIDNVIHGKIDKALVLLPAALLCFAGITKSAQLPFSSWLLGAMVAPTPCRRFCIPAPWSKPAFISSCACPRSSPAPASE